MEEKNLMDSLDIATRLRHLNKAIEELTKENKELKAKINLSDVVNNLLLKAEKIHGDKYDKFTIQIKEGNAIILGHKAISYGFSWGERLYNVSELINDL